MKTITLVIAMVAMVVAMVTTAEAELIGHWKFDQGAGDSVAHLGTLSDSSGKGNDLSIWQWTAAASWTNDRNTVANQAGSFNEGASEQEPYRADPFNELNASGAFTMAAWVYNRGQNTGKAEGAIINQSTSDVWGLRIAGDNGEKLKYFVGGVSAYSTAAVPLNTWTHVAVTYTSDGAASTAKFYINGAPDSTHNQAGGLPAAGGNEFSVGNTGTPDRDGLEGALDEVRLYDHVLSDAEIAALAGVSASTPGTLIYGK
ncbi:MAG: LamG domain-containing protein [Verrucomicrobia bacterium]|jgi:hypothetical protein|nr:LamG domain-containing protein [Verrucomicrobiota bacterium]MBT7700102.1 LamG domain-containing protein [Verrucomicrobiota bacterium]